MHTSFSSIALLLFVSAPYGLAQEQEPTAPQAQHPALDPAAIQARITPLQAIPSEERTEEQTSELQRLEGALRALGQADEERATAREFETTAEGAPAEIESLQAKLQVPIEEVLPALPRDTTLEGLTETIQNLRVDLQAEQEQLQDIERQINERSARRQEILKQIPATTEELRSLQESLAAAADTPLDHSLDDAIRLNRLARKQAADARLARLNAENKGFATVTELMRVRRDHAAREVKIAQLLVDQVQARIDQLRQEQAARAKREADAELRRSADADPLVVKLLEMNTKLTAENQEVTQRLSTLAEENKEDKDKLTRWQAELEQLRTQETRFGLTEAVGMRLRSRQAVLPNLGGVKADLARLQHEMSRASEQFFELSGYSDPQLDELLGRLGSKELPTAEPAALEALRRREELRTALRSTYDDYLDSLLIAARDRRALTNLVQEYSEFIEERIFWVRSAVPLELDELSKVARATRRLLDPEDWLGVLRHSSSSIKGSPFLFSLTLAIAGSLVLTRRRMIRWLVAASKNVRWSYKGHIGTTLAGLLATVGAAAALPSLLWLAALWISDPGDSRELGICIAFALSQAALILFALSFLAQVCRPSGLGEVHFRWRSDTCASVRRELRWFTPLIVPLAFLGRLSWLRADLTFIDDSLARVVGMTGLLIFSVFLDRIFRPRSGVFRHYLASHSSGWANRTRYLWYPLGVLTPLGLAVMAALGYTYTASQILNRLGSMALLAIAFIVGYGILLRALFLGERRLALEKFKDGAAVDKSETLGDDDTLDVAKLSSQARAIVRLVMVVVVTASLLILWIDVLPVLRQLERVELISTGTETVGSEDVKTWLTLADVLISALIFVVTFLISRNLTGTLEMALLRRLPMTPGGRYATETVAKYVVVIIGIVAGFDRLGIGWSKVQFLAAAITVGLGFGLQEIFANFVSGLIILFERPIRVGDTVTVGQITGEVTRIRMRATTITDWDRKELIIPNKEFVTGQVVNWTLSDAVMRARVNVGIAYGSDTVKAREILERVGRENARVLRNPPSDVRFREFGDSSLNFELRVFVREIDDYIPVMDELHDAIDQAFRDAGIEIAFPQRDLHIRSSEAPIEVRNLSKRPVRRPLTEELPDPSSM